MRKGKYNAKRTEFNGRTYASRKEAEYAAKFQALERAGVIRCLKEQVPYTLVEGRDGIRPIKWIADFTYIENETNKFRVIDVKGYRKNPVYLLKKKMMQLLLKMQIEEM